VGFAGAGFLSIDHGIDERRDLGQPLGQIVPEVVPPCELGRIGVADLRLIPVLPHHDLEREIESREGDRLHHRGAGLGAAEDHESRVA